MIMLLSPGCDILNCLEGDISFLFFRLIMRPMGLMTIQRHYRVGLYECVYSNHS